MNNTTSEDKRRAMNIYSKAQQKLGIVRDAIDLDAGSTDTILLHQIGQSSEQLDRIEEDISNKIESMSTISGTLQSFVGGNVKKAAKVASSVEAVQDVYISASQQARNRELEMLASAHNLNQHIQQGIATEGEPIVEPQSGNPLPNLEAAIAAAKALAAPLQADTSVPPPRRKNMHREKMKNDVEEHEDVSG